MSKAFNQISRSPFTRKIEGGKLPRRFAQPTFTIYNSRTNFVEQVSHFYKRMAVHSRNKALMCKVFPSSLGPMAMRWFYSLRKGSISSFKELTRAFRARFMTCSRVLQPLESLLSMTMREGETLKTYSDRYWKMFNRIDRDFDDVAIRTFKVGLPTEHDLRKSLTKKPIRSVRQLMDRIDEYKWVEEDHRQRKGKAKFIPQDRMDFKSDRYNNKDLAEQSGSTATRVVGTVFREPMHQCEKLEKIVIDDDLEKFFQVGAQLPPREKEKLIVFLKRNNDVFVWSTYEAPGVDPNFIYHHLNFNLSIIPKKQPPRCSSKDHSDAVKDEMIKLK
ncbi:uncharacterized protein LOC115990307 [Quercus lobata]|uniref:uncharacterized protein LOC115990307 n=1 Tax=Quercus lobata TaxID=97700 RepID=UPI001245CA05|nr:uncharacterized protein LOC115990307 [Quercus lobata]